MGLFRWLFGGDDDTWVDYNYPTTQADYVPFVSGEQKALERRRYTPIGTANPYDDNGGVYDHPLGL